MRGNLRWIRHRLVPPPVRRQEGLQGPSRHFEAAGSPASARQSMCDEGDARHRGEKPTGKLRAYNGVKPTRPPRGVEQEADGTSLWARFPFRTGIPSRALPPWTMVMSTASVGPHPAHQRNRMVDCTTVGLGPTSDAAAPTTFKHPRANRCIVAPVSS